MSNKHTLQELQELQAMPLSAKINLTKQRIQQWVMTYGLDKVYVSFSGGKDSTVLLHIAREMYGLQMKGAFVDTGMEYPEIREYVRTFENIDWLHPKRNFRQVVTDFGYPIFSKETASIIQYAKKYLEELEKMRNKSEFEGGGYCKRSGRKSQDGGRLSDS